MRNSGHSPASLTTPPARKRSEATTSEQWQKRSHKQRMAVPNVSSALRALWANRMRSLLTTLGVIIGVMAVIAAVTITQGASSFINTTIAGLGTNTLIINSGTAINGGAFAAVGSDRLSERSAAISVTNF